jgi:3-keto-L-gulonate-6-phosphate decarboxylase
MSPVPMLQIAMDYITLPPALAMAVKVASEVDIIEIGYLLNNPGEPVMPVPRMRPVTVRRRVV